MVVQLLEHTYGVIKVMGEEEEKEADEADLIVTAQGYPLEVYFTEDTNTIDQTECIEALTLLQTKGATFTTAGIQCHALIDTGIV